MSHDRCNDNGDYLPFLDRKEWTTEQALEWALQRIRTLLDCGTYYDKAMSALNEAKVAAERTPQSAELSITELREAFAALVDGAPTIFANAAVRLTDETPAWRALTDRVTRAIDAIGTPQSARREWIPIANKPTSDADDGWYIGRDAGSQRPVGMTFRFPVDPDYYRRHGFDAVLNVMPDREIPHG